MRVVLFTGKGGVGKTTLAAASALEAGRRGHRVALVSSDPAHSLGDALGQRLGPTLTCVAPGVEAREVAVLAELEHSWEAIHAWLAPLLLSEGGVEAEEVLVLPGLEELVALRGIAELDAAGGHDLCIVDCAPTAATLRMLRLPEVVDLAASRFFPWKRRAARALRALAAGSGAAALVASDEAFSAIESLAAEIAALRGILLDPARTRARLVTQPARVIVAETRRAHAYLALHGIATDAVFVNRVLPDDAGASFAAWRERECRDLADIEASFDLPTPRVPLLAGEPRGVEALSILGRALYAEHDPAHPMAPAGVTPRFEADASGTRISLDLPHTAPGALDVTRCGDEVEIAFGLARRRIALPEAVAAQELAGASLDAGRLTLRFAPVGP